MDRSGYLRSSRGLNCIVSRSLGTFSFAPSCRFVLHVPQDHLLMVGMVNIFNTIRDATF